MSEYIALMLMGVGVMYFLYDLGFRLIELNGIGERNNEYLALGLLIGTLIFGWLVIHMGLEIARDAGVGASLISDVSGLYRFFLVASLILVFYFMIRILFGPIKEIVERRKYKV